MGGAARKADRDEELAKNAERCEMIERARARGWWPKEHIARDDLAVVVERTLAGVRGGGGFGLADADIDAAVASLRRAA